MCVGLQLYVEEQIRQKDAALRTELKRKDTALKRKDDALKQSKRKIENLAAENRCLFAKTAKLYGADLPAVIEKYAIHFDMSHDKAEAQVKAYWKSSGCLSSLPTGNTGSDGKKMEKPS
ncbi:MAG: hypothetical protein IKD69_10520 [Solobacterium sp.]|nr:hypothetical protein [Solobacterium sp.]